MEIYNSIAIRQEPAGFVVHVSTGSGAFDYDTYGPFADETVAKTVAEYLTDSDQYRVVVIANLYSPESAIGSIPDVKWIVRGPRTGELSDLTTYTVGCSNPAALRSHPAILEVSPLRDWRD